MTTITITTPLNIQKTHFANALEAARFLFAYAKKEEKKAGGAKGTDHASEDLQRTSQEENLYMVAKKNKQTIPLDRAQVEDFAQFQKLIMSSDA